MKETSEEIRKLARAALERHYEPDSKTGCWNWTASISRGGYGRLNFRGKMTPSHRLMGWIRYRFDISDRKIQVCHECDNRRCCNPSHLFVGSNSENSHDAMKKGRLPRGDTHGRSKLSEKDIPKFFEMYENGLSMDAIAARFGVSRPAIRYAMIKKTWAHVPTPKRPRVRIRGEKRVLCLETGKMFNSAADAARHVGAFHQNVSAVCRGEMRTCRGFTFRYAPHNRPSAS